MGAVAVRRLLLLLTLAALAAGCASTSGRQRSQAPVSSATDCPHGVLYRASTLAPIREVLGAAQRLLARETLNSQGTIYHLTPKNAPIDLVEHGLAYEGESNVILNRAAPGALKILRVGEAQCGLRTAQASWAIHYQIPVSVIAGPGAFPFFVKTRRGWRFWGNWCGAGRSKTWRRQYCV
jgi:hypothetical protein